jgi:hypothetical protein
MALQGSDISIVYSGGGSNADPSLSLGGPPSSIPITGILNNLFDNITETESADGFTDFRCFYIFNDNDTDTLHQTKIFLQSQTPAGADIQIGCGFANEKQKAVITGTVTGGSCTLSIVLNGTTYAPVMTSSGGTAGLASSLQTSMNAISALAGAACSQAVNSATGNLEVSITFGGPNINRYMPLFTVTDNAFTGTSVDVSILKVQPGGPLNQIAVQIAGSTVTPSGVTFSTPSATAPIMIGELGPTEGFPVWVKRIVAQNTPGLSDDGAIIRVKGKPFV